MTLRTVNPRMIRKAIAAFEAKMVQKYSTTRYTLKWLTAEKKIHDALNRALQVHVNLIRAKYALRPVSLSPARPVPFDADKEFSAPTVAFSSLPKKCDSTAFARRSNETLKSGAPAIEFFKGTGDSIPNPDNEIPDSAAYFLACSYR